MDVMSSSPAIADDSTSRPSNHLLAKLPSEDYARIASHLRTRWVKSREVLVKTGQTIRQVFFPSAGAYSIVEVMGNGDTAQCALIGNESVVGSSGVFGDVVAIADVVVQVEDRAIQSMPIEVFREELSQSRALYDVVAHFHDDLMTQAMQNAACNALHSARQRCCRWLLTIQARAHTDDFAITHEGIAAMLGLRRPTVTLVLADLDAAGLIRSRRGAVTVLDRPGLELAGCECYEAVKTRCQRWLGRSA